MSIPPKVANELWQRGYALQEAADHAAPPELVAQLSEPWPKFDNSTAGAISFEGGWLQKTLAVATGLAIATKPALDHLEQVTHLRSEIRENLLDSIWSGNAIAIGYSVPRNLSDFPVEIPIDTWEGETDWENSAVCGNNLEFSRTGLYPGNCLRNILRISTCPEIRRRKLRPRKSRIIPQLRSGGMPRHVLRRHLRSFWEKEKSIY